MNSVRDRRVIREIGRIISGGYEDNQDIRTRMMNRIRDLVRHLNENLPFEQPEEKKEERVFDKKYADKSISKIIENLFLQGKVSEEEHNYLVGAIELAERARALENSYKKPMGDFAQSEVVWEKFLSHIPGIGSVLAANLIAKVPCEKYKKVSALWRHCGLHLVCPVCTEKVKIKDKLKNLPVLANEQGLCKKCGRKGVSPVRRSGKNIDYTPNRRTFAWKIGDSLIKQKSPIYYDIYAEEKEKQSGLRFAEGELGKTYEPLYEKGKNPYKYGDVALKKDHAHKRAMRKMIKIFLQHYWVVYRLLARLPVTAPYVQEKMGHVDIITWEDVMRANGQEPKAVFDYVKGLEAEAAEKSEQKAAEKEKAA